MDNPISPYDKHIALNERRALLAKEDKTNEALEELITSISEETT